MNFWNKCFVLIAMIGAIQGYSVPNKGMPPLKSFSPEQYGNIGKVWDIKSAPNGIVYMAADNGLLEFDGQNWRIFTGSKGFTRSLLVLNDSVIYTGSDLDFGVWKRDGYQNFHYESLYPFLGSSSQATEEFWDIFRLDDSILFISALNIYIYRNEQFIKVSTPSPITGSFLVDGELIVLQGNGSLSKLSSFSLEPFFQFPDGIDVKISGIYKNGDDLILVTHNRGLFSLRSGILTPVLDDLSASLREAYVFYFHQFDNEFLFFGTVLRGLLVSDFGGSILHQINRNKGLPNNTILGMHFSDNGMLWLAMDYGISVIDLNDNTTFFYDIRGDYGTPSSALLKDNLFLLGTNQGVFYTPWPTLRNNSEKFSFTLMPGTEGQVWSIVNIENDVLVGHDNGLYMIEGSVARRIASLEGAWNIVPFRDFLLVGNYNGISIFSKVNETWTFNKRMDLIYGSCNQIVAESLDVVWVNIPNYGIIRVALDQALNPIERLIFSDDDFEGDFLNVVLNDGVIQVLTNRKIYSFCAERFIFEVSGEITPDLFSRFPQEKRLITEVLNQDYDFLPISNGFALSYKNFESRFSSVNNILVLRRITSFNNKVTTNHKPGDVISYSQNNLSFEFIVPNRKEVLYQYSLNHKGKWSDWSTENHIDFFDLGQGKYTLYLRALVDGNLTPTLKLYFKVAAPWYKSWLAFFFYALIFVLLVIALLRYQKGLLKKQKMQHLLKERQSLTEQAERHRQQLFLIEQESLRDENEKIKNQLKDKTIELAKKAKDNEDKNRLLVALKEKCEKARGDVSISKLKLNEMQRLMDAYLSTEDRTFEIQMDELHQDFYKKLKKRFPDLSSNDLRLCAYLKIGLSSKEISDILHIQPSSIFISRSRLRKKLELEIEDDLYDFLNRI